MTRICEVRNHQLIIPMPEHYEHKTVRVLIEDEVQEESYEEEMKRAMQDPRFLADMREVMGGWAGSSSIKNFRMNGYELGQITPRSLKAGGHFRRHM